MREQLYLPDGLAPTHCKGGPWSEHCDAGLLKRLVTKYGEAEVADAIRGLAFLRDTGKLKWARPRTKMTLRALVSNQGGDHNWLHTARLAWQREQRAAHPVSVDSLGAILRKAMEA